MKFVDVENGISFHDIHSCVLKPALKQTLEFIKAYEKEEIYIDTLDLSAKSQKRWFYHCFILQLCVCTIAKNHAGKILNYDQTVYIFDRSHEACGSSSSPWNFLNEAFHSGISPHRDQNIVVYQELIQKIKTILPLNILQTETPWCQLMYWADDKSSGEYQELLAKAKALLKKNFNKKFTYEKAHKFFKANGLTFLNEQYFNDVFNKQKLLIT